MYKRKSKRGNYVIEELPDIELSPKLDSKIQRLTDAADAELDAIRVNFRWQREPLSLIRMVAAAMGIPYQTYIKQVLYKQALEDFDKMQSNRQTARLQVRRASRK